MALTIGTDAYVELATANTYLADFGDGSVLDESAIKRATVAIDRLFMFTGTQTSSTQALAFPRNGETTIPKAVQYATAELAAQMLNGFDPYTAPEPVVTEETVKVDVIQTTKKYAGAYAADSLYKLRLILGSLVYASGGGFVFAPIVRA